MPGSLGGSGETQREGLRLVPRLPQAPAESESSSWVAGSGHTQWVYRLKESRPPGPPVQGTVLVHSDFQEKPLLGVPGGGALWKNWFLAGYFRGNVNKVVETPAPGGGKTRKAGQRRRPWAVVGPGR